MMRCFASLLLLLTLPAVAQQHSFQQASVRFLFDWPQGYPWQSYTIDVQSDGKVHFSGLPHADETNDTDPYPIDFAMSGTNLRHAFELAQKLNYFQGDYDSHLKHIAQTGKKTLQYQSPLVHGSTSYNFSQNADIQDLTKLFEAIAMTIDYGRKLAFQYRFDRLGMDQRMKELVDLQASGGVQELQVIAPILHKIADDPNVMNIARQNAQLLLHAIGQDDGTVLHPESP